MHLKRDFLFGTKQDLKNNLLGKNLQQSVITESFYKLLQVSVDPICPGVEPWNQVMANPVTELSPHLALSDVSVCSSEVEKSVHQKNTIGSVISDGVLAPTMPPVTAMSSAVPLPVPNMESSQPNAPTNLKGEQVE